MNVLPVISTNVAMVLLIGGSLVAIFSGLWSLVVAAQRSIWWFLAVLFIPFAGLVFLFVEPRSRKPFVVGLCGAVAVVVAYLSMGVNPEASDPKLIREIKEAVRTAKRQEIEYSTAAEMPLEVRKARITAWQKELEAKKAALKPNDAAAKAAFDEEFKRYLEALEKVKADLAAAPKN